VAVFLFVVWMTSKIMTPPPVAVSPHIIKMADGQNGGNNLDTGGSQLDVPSNEPVVGKDNKTSDAQDNLSTLDIAAAMKATTVDDPEATMPTRLGSRGTGGGLHGGNGPGRGRGKGPGRPGDPDTGVPRQWEVEFSKNTLDAYARQLDFFKIELGVVLPDNKIVYAYNLSKSKPDTRTLTDPAANEGRYYLTWRNGEMQQADQELLARAGVDVGDAVIMKFLPPQVEAALAELERNRAGADSTKIRRTRFGVRPEGAGFTFFVLEQSLRR